MTQNSCLYSLHPEVRDPRLLAENQAELRQGLAAVGRQAQGEFEKLIRQGTPPSIFRAHFDLYYDILVILLRRSFTEILKIGLANWDALDSHPAEWAQRHSNLIVKNLLTFPQHWIKHACDIQQSPDPDRIAEDFEEIVHWRKWRAPKLIYMQPAGNAAYDPAKAWLREDEARTNELLTARSKHFIEFLDLALAKMGGQAHVTVAQDSRYSDRAHGEKRAATETNQSSPPSIESATIRVPTYRSILKTAVMMQLLRKPSASDLDICNGLDEDGNVELPADWKVRADDRQFSQAYRYPKTRRRMEIAFSKIRVDLRERGLVPPR